MPAKPVSYLLRGLLSATFLFAAASGTYSQEGKTLWLPRDEMIGAIVGFAASRCGQPDGPLAALVEPYCKDPSSGFAVHLVARMALGSQNDEALRELCRKHQISECQVQEETSRGQSILVLDQTIAITGSPMASTWSPDNRFLLLGNAGGKGRTHLLDLVSGRLSEQTLGKGMAQASAWSPDGKYMAVDSVGSFQIVSIAAVASLQEVGVLPARKDGCRFRKPLAFTADSRSLWVSCQANDFREASRVALKLSIPELEIEDELLLAPPSGAFRAGFLADRITRYADDLILMGALFRRNEAGWPEGGGRVVLSLMKKQPVYASFPTSGAGVIKHSDDFSSVLLYSSQTVQKLGSKGELPKEWKIEIWDTRSGKRVGMFGGAADADTYMLVPVSVPKSNLLVRAFGSRSSSRKTLVVMDDQIGTVLQEIGPLPTPVGIVVSANGSRVAVFGFRDIRIYKVNRRE
jgi:hypothetical protein